MSKNMQKNEQKSVNEKGNVQMTYAPEGQNKAGGVENQNQSHNTKKVSQGRNTKR